MSLSLLLDERECSLFPFLLDTLSLSESPFSLWAYGDGLDRSFAPSRALTAADRAAVRRVDPLRPRHEDRCGAYLVEAICGQNRDR